MFGGVAAMMLGMKIMGSGLEKFAGSNMKKLLGKVTTNRFAGVGVGVAVTNYTKFYCYYRHACRFC
jgi:phosphate:Na+ symporter